jgi:hypothetical protein
MFINELKKIIEKQDEIIEEFHKLYLMLESEEKCIVIRIEAKMVISSDSNFRIICCYQK